MIESGLPTISLRPMITTFCPAVSMPTQRELLDFGLRSVTHSQAERCIGHRGKKLLILLQHLDARVGKLFPGD